MRLVSALKRCAVEARQDKFAKQKGRYELRR